MKLPILLFMGKAPLPHYPHFERAGRKGVRSSSSLILELSNMSLLNKHVLRASMHGRARSGNRAVNYIVGLEKVVRVKADKVQMLHKLCFGVWSFA